MANEKEHYKVEGLQKLDIWRKNGSSFIVVKGELKGCIQELQQIYSEKEVKVFSSTVSEWEDKKVNELFQSDETQMKPYLTAVGLAEYSYFSQKAACLSVTDKIRLFIAECLEKRADTIIIDENKFSEEEKESIVGCFLNARKVGRLNGLHLIILLCALETEQYLFPDASIEIAKDGTCSAIVMEQEEDETELLMKEMEFRTGTIDDYKALERYHYIRLPKTDIDYICCASYKGVIAAVVVYISPIREIGLKNIEQNNIFQFILTQVICCSRIVANPHFRGLGVTKKLIQYGIETVPCKVMECRSSMLNHTKVLEKWGGIEIEREYRKNVPCYDALCAFLSKWNVCLDDNPDDTFIKKLTLEEKQELQLLILSRLREIDRYQWMYYEQLVRLSANFTEEEYRAASECYISFYQKQYRTVTRKELLAMCRNWNSAAYVLKLRKG